MNHKSSLRDNPRFVSWVLMGNTWIGEPRTDAGGLPIVGWSLQTSDLRVPHFMATHLIQAMVLVGWFADRLSSQASRPSAARIAVAAVAVVGIGLTVATFAQAVGGSPAVPLRSGGVAAAIDQRVPVP